MHLSHVSLSILPVTPKGLECFMPGSVQFIKWLANVPAGPSATVKIEFSSAGNSGPWATVVSNAPNNGIYQWTVPAVNSNNCFLKYTISDGSNTSVVISSNAFGVGTCTNPTAVGEEGDINAGVTIYPNPVIGTTTLTIKDWSAKENWELSILDVTGNIVYRQAIHSEITTITPQLAGGMYFAEITNGERIVKEKIAVIR